jgi:hypothetical protein
MNYTTRPSNGLADFPTSFGIPAISFDILMENDIFKIREANSFEVLELETGFYPSAVRNRPFIFSNTRCGNIKNTSRIWLKK